MLTPLWLSGLLLLPMIRWLHRGGRHSRALPVSHLALWPGAAVHAPAAGQRQPPDPAWRRRALLAALLFLALAGPQWPQARVPVTLWIDDSMSMLTHEAAGTRLAEGLAQARALLADTPPGDVELRALGQPWRARGMADDAAVAELLAGAGQTEPGAPPAALLRPDRLHWLVTDGADAALFDWPGGRRPDRVIQVAGTTRNVGLRRLSARRNTADPDTFELLIELANGGSAVETRELVVIADKAEVVRSTHRLAPGTSALTTLSIPASARVHAALQPGDALARDDEIALDLAALSRRRVDADPACPPALRAAVGAHPALTLATGPSVETILDCGTSGVARTGVATLRVQADRLPARPRGAAQWSAAVSESRRIRLDTGVLRVSARLRAGPADAVVLALGNEPVIVQRAGAAPLIETSLDFAAADLAAGPEIPLLVNLLFERLLGAQLLDGIAVTDRGPESARVVPSARTPVDAVDAGAPAPVSTRLARDATRPTLLAALLVLLWEIVALGRQWARQARSPAMESE